MGRMLKKISVIALPLVLALAGLAFATNADAGRAWGGSSSVTAGNTVTIDQRAATTFDGDPDVPGQQNKRLGVADPSDEPGPVTIRNAWLGYGRVWMRVYLSRWFSR